MLQALLKAALGVQPQAIPQGEVTGIQARLRSVLRMVAKAVEDGPCFVEAPECQRSLCPVMTQRGGLAIQNVRCSPDRFGERRRCWRQCVVGPRLEAKSGVEPRHVVQ